MTRTRTFVGAATALVVALALAVALPAPARAATDATPVSTSAPAVVKTWKTSEASLRAVYDDPEDRMEGVLFRVTVPDPTVDLPQHVYAYGATSTAGIRKTFVDTFSISTRYRPGVYRYVATPKYKIPGSYSTEEGTQRITGSFVVKRKAQTDFSPTGGTWDVKGAKVRFYGSVETPSAERLSVVVQFNAQGKKKFEKRGKAIRVKGSGAWRSKKHRLVKNGAWRAKVLGKGHVVSGTSLPIRSRLR